MNAPAWLLPKRRTHGNYRNPVIVNGKRYPAVCKARDALGISGSKFKSMLSKGEARYA